MINLWLKDWKSMCSTFLSLQVLNCKFLHIREHRLCPWTIWWPYPMMASALRWPEPRWKTPEDSVVGLAWTLLMYAMTHRVSVYLQLLWPPDAQNWGFTNATFKYTKAQKVSDAYNGRINYGAWTLWNSTELSLSSIAWKPFMLFNQVNSHLIFTQ